VDCEDAVPRTRQGGRPLWDPDYIHMNPEGSRTLGHHLLPVVLGALAGHPPVQSPAPAAPRHVTLCKDLFSSLGKRSGHSVVVPAAAVRSEYNTMVLSPRLALAARNLPLAVN